MKNFSTQLNEIGDHNNRTSWSTCTAWLVIFMGRLTTTCQAHAAGEADIGSLQKPGKENTKFRNRHQIETKFIFITNVFLSRTLTQANNETINMRERKE